MGTTICAFITAAGMMGVGHCDLIGETMSNPRMEIITSTPVWQPVPSEVGLEIRAEPGMGYFRRCGVVVMMAAGTERAILPVWLPTCPPTS